MDELAGLLDGPRARGAFLLRVLLASPWSLRIEDEAPLTLLLVVRGTAHVLPDDGPPVRLAAECGCSRAALARRFAALVGEPPMAYLTGLRLAVAADLLRGGDETLGAVARRVGYGSPFALSSAFKRRYGVSPAAYRQG